MSTTLPEMEKPRITEIKVRMDCNGCVQKIKKALHGVNGIYDLYIDFPQQKITIIGCADPQKIAKALKKTRKTAVICSHSEPPDQDQPAAQPSEPATADDGAPAAADGGGSPPAPESPSQPPAETETQPESPKEPPPPENPPISEASTPPYNQPPVHTSKPQDVEEIHVIHHHAPERYGPYGYGGGQWNPRGGAPPPGLVRVEPPQPTYVTHSYNAYRPSHYVTEYAYTNRTSPPTYPQYYTRPPIDHHYTYSNEEHRAGSNGNITSVFSDENPNACTIV